MGHRIGTILRALRQLQEEALQGDAPWPDYGVCKNLDSVLDRAGSAECGYKFVEECAWDWTHAIHQGEVATPVTLTEYFVPRVSGVGLWEGPNLDMRLDLIDHLIRKCEAALAS